MKSDKRISIALTSLLLSTSFLSCQEKANDYAPTQPPIDGYVYSKDVAAPNLVAHWDFENQTKENVSGLSGLATNASYLTGIKGNAYKGATNAFIKYETTPGKTLKDLKSLTTAFWIKTDKHAENAQCVFMLPRTSDFWGNMFFLIEGTTDDRMLVKINFGGQWAELTGDLKLSNVYGKWSHIAFTYDAASSKFAIYVNGSALSIPASMANRVSSGTTPLGALNFVDVSKFIIGGYQQHLGTPWSNPDSWMLPFTGLLDEFRIYNKALNPTEISAIYKLEAKGR
jgi:hypothetical protein